MRYFTVEKEIMRCVPTFYTVASDGTQVGDEWQGSDEQEITTGFAVHFYNEDGTHEDTTFYPVQTDAETFENNEDKVLEEIKRDYPAGDWQNNEW